MKKFKIGRVYRIKYETKGTPVAKEKYSLVSLNGEEMLKLVKDVTSKAVKSEEIYLKCKENWAPYIFAVKALEDIKKQKKEIHRRKKSLIEADLEDRIAKMRKRLFKKSKKAVSDREKARNLFIRVLDTERITIVDTNDKDAFDVLYAGKMLTHKGNTVHKFYFLEQIKIENHEIPQEALPYLNVANVMWK